MGVDVRKAREADLKCPSCEAAAVSGFSLTYDFRCRDCCARLYRATFPLARPGVMFQIARFQPSEVCDEIAAAELGAVAA